MSKHLVAALIEPPFPMFELACAAEIFGMARPEFGHEWYDFRVAGQRRGLATSNAQLALRIDHGLEILNFADTIVVPGWDPDLAPSAEQASALVNAHQRGARLLSICSGAFLLAATGLLDGRRATTHWRYAQELARRYPAVEVEPDVLYVDEGQVITAAGSAAGLDMLLHVVRKDHGPNVSNAVARRLVIPPHRDGGQAQFIQRPVPAANATRLGQLIDWMRANAVSNVTMGELAQKAAMSPRTFFRRFREETGSTPNEWIIRERVAIAKELLEHSTLSIDQVATATGFGATETLRHHFRRLVGNNPASYRRAFGAKVTPYRKQE